MAELKKLRKENEVLKNQIEELSKDFKEFNARISSAPRRHIDDERDQSFSIQFSSDKYDELLSSYNVEKKEIQLLNSRVAEIAIPLFSENVCPGLIINNNPEEHHHNNIYVRSNDQLWRRSSRFDLKIYLHKQTENLFAENACPRLITICFPNL